MFYFDEYTMEELAEIFALELSKRHYHLDEGLEDRFGWVGGWVSQWVSWSSAVGSSKGQQYTGTSTVPQLISQPVQPGPGMNFDYRGSPSMSSTQSTAWHL